MPAWEFTGLGYTLPFNVLFPTVILPGIMFTLMMAYPWLEARFSGDHEYHNLLDRPRDVPIRTAIGTMSLSFYIVLMIAGGNDVIASIFSLNVNQMSYVLRGALLIVPPLVYVITKRWCLALQRGDDDLLHHGIESGTVRRLPSGEFIEETVPLPAPHRIALTRVAPDSAAITGGNNPGGPGYDLVGQGVTQTEPKRGRGFFRPKPGESGAEADLPELERSGKSE